MLCVVTFTDLKGSCARCYNQSEIWNLILELKRFLELPLRHRIAHINDYKLMAVIPAFRRYELVSTSKFALTICTYLTLSIYTIF